MRAVVMHETGGPEVLLLEEIEAPAPQDGQVLARVRAASVNPIEWKQRCGLMEKPLPAVLGSDFAGTVVESRVTGFAEGDEIFGLTGSGAYAELVTAYGAAIAIRPPDLSPEHAAALPVVGLTAWQALFDRGGLQRGQRVLIAGAAGGVGHIAVQLAKRAGGHVIGTASERNRERVMALGADEFIDYTSESVAEAAGEIDLAVDTVGGEATLQALAALRSGGVLVTIAAAPPQEQAAARGARAELLIMSPDAQQLAELASLAAAGDLEIDIAEVMGLGQAGKAHELSESGHARGKIILTVTQG